MLKGLNSVLNHDSLARVAVHMFAPLTAVTVQHQLVQKRQRNIETHVAACTVLPTLLTGAHHVQHTGCIAIAASNAPYSPNAAVALSVRSRVIEALMAAQVLLLCANQQVLPQPKLAQTVSPAHCKSCWQSLLLQICCAITIGSAAPADISDCRSTVQQRYRQLTMIIQLLLLLSLLPPAMRLNCCCHNSGHGQIRQHCRGCCRCWRGRTASLARVCFDNSQQRRYCKRSNQRH
jgi:hypothetical protein